MAFKESSLIRFTRKSLKPLYFLFWLLAKVSGLDGSSLFSYDFERFSILTGDGLTPLIKATTTTTRKNRIIINKTLKDHLKLLQRVALLV